MKSWATRLAIGPAIVFSCGAIASSHKELVDSGKMTNRAFHDAILRENSIAIEMVRASLTRQKLTRDFNSTWKFYGSNSR